LWEAKHDGSGVGGVAAVSSRARKAVPALIKAMDAAVKFSRVFVVELLRSTEHSLRKTAAAKGGHAQTEHSRV